MQIDWFSFTPIPSLLGGMILGIAAALYVLLHGRILGVSGIISGLLHPKLSDSAWRVSLILGLVSAPFMAALFFGIFPVVEIESDWIAIVIAGWLVLERITDLVVLAVMAFVGFHVYRHAHLLLLLHLCVLAL
jgi:uncharacterized protein